MSDESRLFPVNLVWTGGMLHEWICEFYRKDAY
jgi:hypothetical protein